MDAPVIENKKSKQNLLIFRILWRRGTDIHEGRALILWRI